MQPPTNPSQNRFQSILEHKMSLANNQNVSEGNGVNGEGDICVGEGQGKRRFRAIRKLGSSKFGSVILAYQLQTNTLVTIKILQKLLVPPRIQPSLISQLKIHHSFSHPNILQIYGILSDTQNIYVIMQPTIEGSLNQEISDKFWIQERDTFNFIRQVCSGIAHMHQRGVLWLGGGGGDVLRQMRVLKIHNFGTAMALSAGQVSTPKYKRLHHIQMQNLGALFFSLLAHRNHHKITAEEVNKSCLSHQAKNLILHCLDGMDIRDLEGTELFLKYERMI